MSRSPVWRLLLSQRLMVERETPKSCWTSLLGMPRSMAASALNLRSFEYAFMWHILTRVRYLRKPLSDVRIQHSAWISVLVNERGGVSGGQSLSSGLRLADSADPLAPATSGLQRNYDAQSTDFRPPK